MNLFLSSVASGLIATGAMIIFLYLPVLWGGLYYDTLGALGSIFQARVDARARMVGVLLLLLGGVVFAFFYGWYTLMFLGGPFPAPAYVISNAPVEINLFYPLFGLVAGFCHGIFITLITTFIVTDHHPVESYREVYPLILSFMVGHTVYGMTVMFFQSQFLQLLPG
jgi:hypothetical protein